MINKRGKESPERQIYHLQIIEPNFSDMAHVVDSPMKPVEATDSTGIFTYIYINIFHSSFHLYICNSRNVENILNSIDIEMKDIVMESKHVPNGDNGDSNLDFCTGDDFLPISHATALVSPSGSEFDLVVKVFHK